MEGAFGSSFSGVEIHTDSNAAQLSKDMNARAFTVGNHIAFAGGEHKPGTIEGDALMAHELSHTIQQADGETLGTQQKGADSNVLEQDADKSALLAVTGIWGKGNRHGKNEVLPKAKSGLGISRCKTCPKTPLIRKTLSVFQLAGHRMNAAAEVQGAKNIWESEAGITFDVTNHPPIDATVTASLIGSDNVLNVNPVPPTAEEDSLSAVPRSTQYSVFFVQDVLFGGWTNVGSSQVYVSRRHCEDGFTLAHELAHLIIGTGHGHWSSPLMHPNNCIGHSIDTDECLMARGDREAIMNHYRNRQR
jgi:hypothetical protein